MIPCKILFYASILMQVYTQNFIIGLMKKERPHICLLAVILTTHGASIDYVERKPPNKDI